LQKLDGLFGVTDIVAAKRPVIEVLARPLAQGFDIGEKRLLGVLTHEYLLFEMQFQ
jgi:hypothetical protein